MFIVVFESRICCQNLIVDNQVWVASLFDEKLPIVQLGICVAYDVISTIYVCEYLVGQFGNIFAQQSPANKTPGARFLRFLNYDSVLSNGKYLPTGILPALGTNFKLYLLISSIK